MEGELLGLTSCVKLGIKKYIWNYFLTTNKICLDWKRWDLSCSVDCQAFQLNTWVCVLSVSPKQHCCLKLLLLLLEQFTPSRINSVLIMTPVCVFKGAGHKDKQQTGIGLAAIKANLICCYLSGISHISLVLLGVVGLCRLSDCSL